MKTLKRLFAATLFVLVAGLVSVNLPQTDAMAKTPVASLNLSSSGLALRGYDPVAYFTAGKPVKGSSKITAKHAGGTYHFSSEANKQSFYIRKADKSWTKIRNK